MVTFSFSVSMGSANVFQWYKNQRPLQQILILVVFLSFKEKMPECIQMWDRRIIAITIMRSWHSRLPIMTWKVQVVHVQTTRATLKYVSWHIQPKGTTNLQQTIAALNIYTVERINSEGEMKFWVGVTKICSTSTVKSVSRVQDNWMSFRINCHASKSIILCNYL